MNAAPPKQKIAPTTRQLECLKFIQGYHATCGQSPTLQEIAEAMGGISVQTVLGHLEKLKKRGWIVTLPGAQRSITLL